MTVKEAMTKVSEKREAFPLGWNTDLKEVYSKSGKALKTGIAEVEKVKAEHESKLRR